MSSSAASSSSASTTNPLLRVAMPLASSLILAYYVFTLPMSFLGGGGGGSGVAELQQEVPAVQSQSKVGLSAGLSAPPPPPQLHLAPPPPALPMLPSTSRDPSGGKAADVKVNPDRKEAAAEPEVEEEAAAAGEEEEDVRGQADLDEETGLSRQVFHSLEAFKSNYKEMEKKFKVFIYPDGDPNTYFHTPRKLTGKYASEGYFFQNLRESKFVTKNPNKAHLFFIPISCHKMRGKGINYEGMAEIIHEYVELLVSKYPYWNRTLGADHFFVTCHDIGARATNGVPNLVKNSIRVVCSPSYSGDFIPHKDVAMPQVLQPFALPRGGNDVKNRTILGFWAGHRNSRIRVVLARLWENDTQLAISNNRISRVGGGLVYQKQFYRSKFCICPGGSQVNSARVADSIHYGCVPVILSDFYDLPFNDVIQWKKFAVLMREKDVTELKQRLLSMPRQEFLSLHRGLLQVQDRFEWHTPPLRYDAFHMVMYELWLRHFIVQYKR